MIVKYFCFFCKSTAAVVQFVEEHEAAVDDLKDPNPEETKWTKVGFWIIYRQVHMHRHHFFLKTPAFPDRLT